MKYLPNILSSLRIFLVIPILYLLKIDFIISAAILFLFSSLTDYFDGYLARKYLSESDLGAFLDLIADKILVTSLLIWLVFLLNNQFFTIITILIILRELIITSFRYYLVLNNNDHDLIKANIFGKIKTAFQFLSIFLIILSPLFDDFYFSFVLILLSVSVLFSYFSLMVYFLNWKKK